CRSLNSEPSKKLYKAVVGYVGLSESVLKARFLECANSPKQVNGYDCGYYVMAIARVICDWHVNSEKTGANNLWFSVVKERVTSSYVDCMRTKILVFIRDLMAKRSGQQTNFSA
ncbi:hypothetical protein RYX36_028752, partial [Vicia faba]